MILLTENPGGAASAYDLTVGESHQPQQRPRRLPTTSPQTEPLLPAIAQGQPEAVQACIKRYSALIWSLALKHSPDRHTAEDAVQEIFTELWQSADRFDAAKASETTFVAMIARRRLIDQHRRRAARPHSRVVDHNADTQTAEKQSVPECVAQSEEAQIAYQLLDELSTPAKTCIKLSVNQGCTHQEIAEQLNLPLGSVKSHIRRGLLKLRDKMMQDQASTNDGNQADKENRGPTP